MGNAWTKNNVSSGGVNQSSMQFKNNLGSTTRVMKDSTASIMISKEQIKDEETTRSPDDNDFLVVSAAV
jgi:hypothetical protein